MMRIKVTTEQRAFGSYSPVKKRVYHPVSSSFSYPPIMTETRSYIELVRYGYSFFYDVIRRALNLWRHPLSFILFLWLTSLLYTPLFWVTTIALKPLCGIPGIQQSRFCSNNTTIHPDFPHLVKAQTITFEQLLDNSVGGSGLSLEIKKAELAVVDLITLVEYSQLSNRQTFGMWCVTLLLI